MTSSHYFGSDRQEVSGGLVHSGGFSSAPSRVPVMWLAPGDGTAGTVALFAKVHPNGNDAAGNPQYIFATGHTYELEHGDHEAGWLGRILVADGAYESFSWRAYLGAIASARRVGVFVAVRSAGSATLTLGSAPTSDFSGATPRTSASVTGPGVYWLEVTSPGADAYWYLEAAVASGSLQLAAAIAMRGQYGSGSLWESIAILPGVPPAPPGTPTPISPLDAAIDVFRNATLQWSALGATSFDVKFGTTNPPPTVSTGQTGAAYAPAAMDASSTYYWQVIAHNAGGDATGPVWSFTTGTEFQVEETDMYACNGRLTLVSGDPVPRTDQTAKATLYFTPYAGNRIALYSGAAWSTLTFAELSLSIAGYAADTNFDVFAYNNAGALALETVAWTNATTRATALVLQDGVYVKSGATTRRYLGTFRTTGTIGQTEDSLAKRFVWNRYNRARRPLCVRDLTSTWTYTTATWRQANGSSANQLAVLVGLAEAELEAQVIAHAKNATTGVFVKAGIGEDSSSAPATNSLVGDNMTSLAAADVFVAASYRTHPSVGYHYYAWLEISAAAGTTYWMGRYDTSGGGTYTQSGITGSIDG